MNALFNEGRLKSKKFCCKKTLEKLLGFFFYLEFSVNTTQRFELFR